MYFYQVKPEADQCHRSDGSILIGGELYTESEVIKYGISKKLLKRISVPTAETYIMFGARFC